MAIWHQQKRKSSRCALVKSTLCLAILTAMGNVHAEETKADNTKAVETQKKNDKDIEVIEVRGIRASMAQNLNIKRMSNAVVDAITAEDIGKFPDKNVADSLQRVPGVIIQRDGGEGATVSIRGLSSDLTFTQLNGNFIASSPGDPSRSFDYSLLPSAMISMVEVFKSPEARLDEGGVGGTVILHTRTPFAMEANSGLVNVEYTYADVTDKYEPQFAGVYSWKNEDEDFGLLVGYTRQHRTNRTLSGGTNANIWRWNGDDANPPVDVNGNPVDNNNGWGKITDARGQQYQGIWFPQVVRTAVVKEQRERDGIQVTGQWRPADDWEVTANYFHFNLGQDRTLSAVDMPEWLLSPDFLTAIHLDPSGTIATGMDFSAGAGGAPADMQFPWIRGTYVREESSSDTFDFKINYEGDDFTARLIAGHTSSEGGPAESWEAAYKSSNWGEERDSISNAAQYAGWSLGSDRVSMYMDPNTLNNLLAGAGGGRDPGSSNSSFVRSTLEETYVQLDTDFYVEWGLIDKVSVGAKYRHAKLHRETGNNFFISPDLDVEARLAAGEEITRFDSYQWNGGMPLAMDILNTSGEGNIAGGFDINLMPTIDWEKYRSLILQNYVPYTRIEDNFVYDIEETISAMYLQGDFSFSDFRGNLGVRVVRTETLSSSTDLYTFFLDHTDDATGEPVTGDDRFVENYDLISRETSDTHVLPSFNLAWDATDNLVVRTAVAKVISRPGYNAMGSQERISWVSEEWADDRKEFNVLPGFRGSGGNKDLKPFESLQADLSVEYYYGEGSAVGAALFYKKVDNFVVPLVIESTRFYQGMPGIIEPGEITVSPYSTTGNGTDAKSQGWELFMQHSFESGFGLYANYTRNDTNQAGISVDGLEVGESPLVGSADYQYNLSAYYENDDFSIRGSYNKRGEVVQGINSGLNVYQDPYDQLDVNASYSITEALTLTGSVINLTESEQTSRVGNDTTARLLNTSYSGRRFYAGISYKF
ncbi:TonB-dependent receptor [Shewanella submarina]|uniref:TonB-dependent receptor n=1 Tax=Shewanella submarina TaxID=2016376 RepID=A0ABV7GFH1_9GAMM|nr:TonB-dependent receptor [Shewanella submarina]MCL1036810.1 TonB-dependent receptor [Shewanella submarina]